MSPGRLRPLVQARGHRPRLVAHFEGHLAVVGQVQVHCHRGLRAKVAIFFFIIIHKSKAGFPFFLLSFSRLKSIMPGVLSFWVSLFLWQRKQREVSVNPCRLFAQRKSSKSTQNSRRAPPAHKGLRVRVFVFLFYLFSEKMKAVEEKEGAAARFVLLFCVPWFKLRANANPKGKRTLFSIGIEFILI